MQGRREVTNTSIEKEEAKMQSRRRFIVLAAAVALLSLSCESGGEITKEKCLTTFSDLKEQGQQGPPGPIVDLEPKGDTVVWRTKKGAQPVKELEYGDPCCDAVGYPAAYLKLREDFIGVKTLQYKFVLPDDSVLPQSRVISVSSADDKIRVTITRPEDDSTAGLTWTIYKKVVGVPAPITCVLVPKDIASDADKKICKEFEGMDLDKIWELTKAKKGKGFNVQVEYVE
jgi:hypothetical protein